MRHQPFLVGLVSVFLALSACAPTTRVTIVGATHDITYESSIKTFEKVEQGMGTDELARINLGPGSPGVAMVVFDTGRKHIRLQTSQGELTPLPPTLKEQCVDILSHQNAKECYALLVERQWENKELVSSQSRRLLGYKKFAGERRIFKVVIFVSPDRGVIYKSAIEVRANVPLVEEERDYYKPLDGLPTTVFGTMIGGAISGF